MSIAIYTKFLLVLTTNLIKSGQKSALDLTLRVVTLEPLFKAAIKLTIKILDTLLLMCNP